MTYARARLWLGITGVGTIVVWCVLLLALRVPARFLPINTTPDLSRDASALTLILFVYAAIQGVFDFFGGHILPTEYGRTTRKFGAFLTGWLRGVVAHSAVLLGVGLTLIWAARVGAKPGAIAAFVWIAVLLYFGQTIIARLVTNIHYRQMDDADAKNSPLPTVIAHFANEDEAVFFTGGIIGNAGRDRLVIPARWHALPDEERTALLTRKMGTVQTGSRALGHLLALGFNLAGFFLILLLTDGTASVAGVVTTSLWFTLWSFGGLLILPTPSQAGVFAADRYALENGVSRETLSAVIRKTDRDQDDEPARPGSIERIFHPIPSVERRLARLSAPEPVSPGAWHAARTAIYLSWAGMSFLSRAVHCNAGRPEVWVFLPSD